MEKFMQIFTSETAMKIINALFFLSTAIRNSRFGFFAYLLWGAYLICCIKQSASGASRVVYICLLAFVIVMLTGGTLALLGVI